MQQVQEAFGYLPEEAMRRIARHVDVPECSVFGVATFYTQFQLLAVDHGGFIACCLAGMADYLFA